ncbi:MAG: ECF transporter S component [Ruminococcaceae bacterium]|nr:ECF transporter S component [Oscillospiraceae bacterium]
MKNTNQKILRMVQIAMLIALVVVLQVISAMIPPIGGMVSITLTLVPVVVGAILFGKKGGAILGFAFGAIVLINCITALDPGGHILWNTNPFFTLLICFAKGIAAGFVPAIFYQLVKGKAETVSNSRKYGAALVAALTAPVVNTGLFVCGMLLFFKDTLYAWAGGTEVLTYILLGLAGLNFLVEFLINIILTPAIVRIVDVVGNRK